MKNEEHRQRGHVIVRNVSKSYGQWDVLKKINLEAQPGSVVCIVGPSGAGKSTLLRCINHLVRIDEGYISVDGVIIGYEQKGCALHEMRESKIAKQRTNIGMVFQDFGLFPHMTVMQNIIEGPIHAKSVDKNTAEAVALDLLNQVGLKGFENKYPRTLSGGQQQRVAIARALSMEPSVLLFDEPTSALDPELVGEVVRTMRSLADKGYTMLVASHEMAFVRELADCIVFMEQGSIVEQCNSEELLAGSIGQRTRDFLSSIA